MLLEFWVWTRNRVESEGPNLFTSHDQVGSICRRLPDDYAKFCDRSRMRKGVLVFGGVLHHLGHEWSSSKEVCSHCKYLVYTPSLALGLASFAGAYAIFSIALGQLACYRRGCLTQLTFWRLFWIFTLLEGIWGMALRFHGRPESFTLFQPPVVELRCSGCFGHKYLTSMLCTRCFMTLTSR